MSPLLPPAAAEPWSGTALAGAAFYLLLFALSLWGTWCLVRGGADGPGAPPSDAGRQGPP